MATITVTNLTASNLSMDISVPGQDEAVRLSLAPSGSEDIGDRISMDDLNKSESVKTLLAAGRISIKSDAEADDVEEELKRTSLAVLGAPILADVDRIVVSVQITDGALTIAAQPDTPRNITMTLTDADDSVTSVVTALGLDPAGRAVSEVMRPDGAGGGKTLVGTKIFASITSVTPSDTVGSTGADVIVVGVGDVIGLPSDIDAAAAVKHTYLGAVLVTPDAVAVGLSSSGVDANGGTYDGSKLLRVLYNLGE